MTTKRTPLFDVSLIAGLSIIFIISDCPELWARAGGGGGGGATGILYIILLPFFIIYSIIMTHMVVKKNKECQTLIKQCADIDPVWNPDSVKARIEQAFFKIQQAWVERNQDIAKDYMSERLYNKHKTQTDAMIVNKRKNILDRLNLIEAKVVQIADFKDDSKDSFWVYLEASAIDYEIDEASGSVSSGKKDKEERFAELWKFIRLENTWVVDEIDQKVSIGDLSHLKSLVER